MSFFAMFLVFLLFLVAISGCLDYPVAMLCFVIVLWYLFDSFTTLFAEFL